jgi:hypothetical protein
VHSLLLKAAATALTLVAAAAAAVHVGGHVKKLSPAVRTSDVQTVTSTYVS